MQMHQLTNPIQILNKKILWWCILYHLSIKQRAEEKKLSMNKSDRITTWYILSKHEVRYKQKRKIMNNEIYICSNFLFKWQANKFLYLGWRLAWNISFLNADQIINMPQTEGKPNSNDEQFSLRLRKRIAEFQNWKKEALS